jgi:hypothetical protein
MIVDWKSYAELLGMVAVVASLVFVGLELRQSQNVARAEMHANNLANVIDVRNARIANAEIWAKGNANGELTPIEELIYAQLVYMTNERFWYAIEQFKLLGLDEGPSADIAQFSAFLHENPRARSLWRLREDQLAKYRGIIDPNERFTPGWIAQVETAIAKFEREAGNEK